MPSTLNSLFFAQRTHGRNYNSQTAKQVAASMSLPRVQADKTALTASKHHRLRIETFVM